MCSRFARVLQISAITVVLLSGLVAADQWRVTRSTSTRSTSTNPASFDAPPISSVRGLTVGPGGLYSMASGDFNNDGIADFAVVGFACASGGTGDATAVYLGRGDGTFRAPVKYGPVACPYQVVAARLRGPNAPEDLITVDVGYQRDGISILRGNGDGTFESPTFMALPSTPTAAAVGDFNNDGKIDIAVALFGGSGQDGGNLQTLAILIAQNDGTFSAPVLYQSLNNLYGVAVGDFNNDGKIDIVTRNPDALALSLGGGDGTFLPAYVILAEPSTLVTINPPGPILYGLVSFITGDFNEDGNLDIVAQEDGERFDVLLGTGAGTFAPPATYLNNEHQTGFGGGQIAAARLTASGHLDVVVNTGYGTTLALFRGNGDGTFQTPPTLYPLPQYDDEGLVLADLNNDGKIDIVTGTTRGSYLTALLNRGNANFGPPPPLYSIIAAYDQVTASNAVGIKLADLTGTGKLDIITTDWDLPIEPVTNDQLPQPPVINPATGTIDTHGSISILAANGDGTFQPEKQYFVGGRPIAVDAASLTNDGKIDIVTVDAFSGTVSILKGNGDRTFQEALSIAVGANPVSLALADFNGDGKIDIAVTNLVDNNVAILINQSMLGEISFKPPVTYSVGTYPSGIVTADFNHDGKLDLAVVNSGDYFTDNQTALSILPGNGDGTFATAATQQLWTNYGGNAIYAGDFGRGEIDLALIHFDNAEVMIMNGHGDGTFTRGASYNVGQGPETLAVADFNGDGRIDIAVAGLNDYSVAVLHGNGDGTFVPVANQFDDSTQPFGFATWGYPAFMAAGDLNGDGRPEIVTTHLFEAAVAVLRNATPTPVQLAGVVSRKLHANAGTYDVDLNNGEVECRSGGPNGDYTVVFTFANPLTRVAGATSSSGRVTSGGTGSDPHQYVVQLTGLASSQRIDIALSNVEDSSGHVSSTISATLPLLLGDSNADGVVNSADISQTKSQSGQSVGSSNFREDLNVDGSINSADISLVKSKSGTGLP